MRKVSSVRKKLKNNLVITFYNKLMTRKLDSPAVMTCEELSPDDVQRLRKKIEKSKQQQKRPVKRPKPIPTTSSEETKAKKRKMTPPPPAAVYQEPEISFVLPVIEEELYHPPMISYQFEERQHYVEEHYEIPTITYEFEAPAEPPQYSYLYIPSC